MTSPVGPRGLTQRAADRTAAPSDLRQGTVVAVTARGVDVSVAGGLVPGAAHLASYSPAVGDTVSMIAFADSWLIIGRAVGPGTTTDTATIGPAVGLTQLAACYLPGTNATLASSSGSVVVVPKYSVRFHHPAGHYLLVAIGVNVYSSVVNDWTRYSLRSGNAGTPLLGQWDEVQAGNNLFGQRTTQLFVVPPVYGGVGHSYYLDMQRGTGTGTARVDDSTSRNGFIVVMDLGDASMVSAT